MVGEDSVQYLSLFDEGESQLFKARQDDISLNVLLYTVLSDRGQRPGRCHSCV